MTAINWLKRANESDKQIRNFIHGEYAETQGIEIIKKYSPRGGQLLYEFGCGDAQIIEQAVTSARNAYLHGSWSRLPAQQRKAILYKLADLVDAHAEELALLECLDVGKPITNAQHDIVRVASILRYHAEAVDKLFGQAYTDGPSPNMSYQVRKPIGVVAAIVGWNSPLVLAVIKMAPALAMGNSLVLKPSEFTSLSASRAAELAIEAGVPAGIFNVVHGTGTIAGNALARHPDIDLLTFTGSTATGKQIMISAGQSNMKRVMLECGGKSPYIIFDDCPDDFDMLAQDIVWTAFQNQGEVCSAGTRVLLQDSIKERLLPKLLEYTKKIQPQDPFDSNAAFGALINEVHLEKVLNYIEQGQQQGANLLYGGERVFIDVDGCEGGYYIKPALFDVPDSQITIAQEEIFGPVLSILTFKSEDEAVRIANDTPYGLAAYVCTQSIGRAQRMGQRLNAGVVMIVNTLNFSAGSGELGYEAQKQSGFGAEGGLRGLNSYTATNTVHILT